ncbi:ABC transporter permease YtrF precursor [Pirellulimonas nuda]|uniref:ABC transporter permease YtrF n=1 Tax=Pirellulimonas nuda TaxID=2528009 RepID=A0A518DH81_9BACT|nr:ABC transporter permease [Pirellulimonas nuda]QDU90826.1 ABC transporter permease YtrF precursor [Pirellulimonas nuda]
MSYWKIAWRNMLERGLASALTAFSMALGVAAVICVLVVHSAAVDQFSQDAQGYHLIVGGKGGATQLVLSTVYHLDKPLYPIPYGYYRQFVDGRFAKITETAIPYCLGDSFYPNPERASDAQFRVVATTSDLFDKLAYGATSDGTPKRYTFASGRNFRTDHAYESVLGSVVAAQSGLKVGDTINPTHDIDGGDFHDPFTIVGILAPTGTANDRAVFVNVEGFYLQSGHSLSADMVSESGATPEPLVDDPKGILPPAELYDSKEELIEPLPVNRREVTSILVKCTSDLAPNLLLTQINKDNESVAQAVAPIGVVSALLEKVVTPLQVVLLALTVLVVLVAAIGVLVSIYNSMSERSHDIAVLRALGASRTAVVMIILFEAILIALVGGAAGVLMGHGLIAAVSPMVVARTGVSLGLFQFSPLEAMLVPGLVLLAVAAGIIPALAAYRTDVAKALK